MRDHRCYAPCCQEQVSASELMCAPHWARVSSGTRAAVWQAYRPGQEHDLELSEAYIACVHRAVAEVASATLS